MATVRTSGVVVMPRDSESDKLLLEGFCAGDDGSARTFVERFSRRLRCIAFRIVGDAGSADDVVQIAFEKAWKRGATFDPERGSLDSWVASIARNAALDWVRMKRALPLDPFEICAKQNLGSFDPELQSGVKDRPAEIRSALASLPPALVRSALLSGAFDLTAAEVASYEHIPLGTAKSRIRTAKLRLRRELECSAQIGA
jgi:RNA polymerase sigma-70 factor (ECF subfamily)